MLRATRQVLKENDMMAYLAMMAVRLVELHRVLKPTGSLYLHCDPTASHYLKIILDGIFGAHNYRNEISWKRSQPKSHTTVNWPVSSNGTENRCKDRYAARSSPWSGRAAAAVALAGRTPSGRIRNGPAR